MLSAHILRGQMLYHTGLHSQLCFSLIPSKFQKTPTFFKSFLNHLEPTMRISDGQVSRDSMTHPLLAITDHHIYIKRWCCHPYGHHKDSCFNCSSDTEFYEGSPEVHLLGLAFTCRLIPDRNIKSDVWIWLRTTWICNHIFLGRDSHNVPFN